MSFLIFTCGVYPCLGGPRFGRIRVFSRRRGARNLGVIDTLSAGYAAVNRRLWLLSIPIALDLVFWAGPRLGLDRFTTTVALPLATSGQADGVQTVPASFDLLMLLAIHVPTSLGRALTVGQAEVVAAEATGPGAALLLALVLIPLGLLLASVYLTAIAQLIRKQPFSLAALQQSVIPVWGRALKLHLLLLAVGVGVGVPVGVMLFLAAAIHTALAMMVFIALQLAIIWAAIYLYFALPAVVVGAHGPIAAIRSSVQVVRTSLWSALGLIAIILVISVGIPLIWQLLGSQPLGVLVGIVANAYVMTGLSAATLLFYDDRTREAADSASPDAPPPAPSPSE